MSLRGKDEDWKWTLVALARTVLMKCLGKKEDWTK